MSADDPYWWLSFADDTGNLGVCIVQAADHIAAVFRTHELGINPGGEVAIWGPFPRRVMEIAAENWLDRLMTKTEVEALDEIMLRRQN